MISWHKMMNTARYTGLVALLAASVAAGDAAPVPPVRLANLQAWRDARFGMFVHWGVYSSLGNQWKGKTGGAYAEHVQRVLKIPIAEYRSEVAGHFDPEQFDADQWVSAAKHAGMGYLVITAKHHDGFAMWPSKASTYNIHDATPFKRDPMAELKAACDRHGVLFGFYYSHAFDWGEKDAPGNDWDYQNPGGDKLLGGTDWWKTRPEFLANAHKYVDEKCLPQLKELITTYHPAILWFDTPHKLPPEENERILQFVRDTDPSIVVNGRLLRGHGDYLSTCDKPVDFPPNAGDWEAIPTTNNSYGYNPLDHAHHPTEYFVQLVVKAAARGGNMLLNVGPRGDGTIDPIDLATLYGIGDWWKTNGESIRGTTATPLPVQAWGQSTRNGNTLYLHVFDWPKDGKLTVGGLASAVAGARLLGDPRGDGALAISRTGAQDVQLTGLPTAPPFAVDSVIALQCTGDIQAGGPRLIQPGFVNSLHVFDGQLHDTKPKTAASTTQVDDFGRTVDPAADVLRFGAGAARDDYVEGFGRADQSISWPIRVSEPGRYQVKMDYAADASSAGGTYTIRVGDQTLTGTVSPSAGTDRTARRTVDTLGELNLTAGEYELSVFPSKVVGTTLFKPRQVQLVPVALADAK